MSMTVGEMRNKQDQQNLVEEIKQHPDGKLLINGAVSEELQRVFSGLASKNAADFTIVNDATAESEGSIREYIEEKNHR
ncbi:DUF1694 domain-containing protein [Enterococcus songbeiensis]|uniref:DUF1694 domain-containing protein n=1 Tax=Enterococcus TaxID=1350 RepID=UPI0035305B0A